MMKVDESSIATLNDKNQQEWAEAVSQDLYQIAILHDCEVGEDLVNALREVNFPNNLGLRVSSKVTKYKVNLPQSQQFFEKALQELPETIDPATLDGLAVDYADIYLNHSLHASPYESVWLDEDHLIQQEPMFQIRECYKRYGMVTTNWRIRSEDHLVLQMQFIASLLDPESNFSESIPLQKRLEDATKFMDEHLLLWLSDFSRLVSQRCRTDFYASAVVLTSAYMEQFRDDLVEITGIARPTEEEIEVLKKKAANSVQEEPIKFMPGVAESW